jgi:hypothetical protein
MKFLPPEERTKATISTDAEYVGPAKKEGLIHHLRATLLVC